MPGEVVGGDRCAEGADASRRTARRHHPRRRRRAPSSASARSVRCQGGLRRGGRPPIGIPSAKKTVGEPGVRAELVGSPARCSTRDPGRPGSLRRRRSPAANASAPRQDRSLVDGRRPIPRIAPGTVIVSGPVSGIEVPWAARSRFGVRAGRRAAGRVDRHELPVGVLDEREQVAAHAAHVRVDDRERHGGVEGGVDGVAAGSRRRPRPPRKRRDGAWRRPIGRREPRSPRGRGSVVIRGA